MEVTKERMEELFEECLTYLVELKDHDDKEDWDFFWKDIIGMTDEEMKYYSLEREDDEEDDEE